jgi:hypothetical protein
VDGILSTHQTKEAFAQNLVAARAMRDSRLSILPNSPSYVDIVTGASKGSDIESTGTGKEDDDTFAELGAWENLDDDVDEDDRKPAAKGLPSKTRQSTTSDSNKERGAKGSKSPKPDADATTQALLAAVLSLKGQVESMSKWSTVKAKKKKVKGGDEVTDVSDSEEDAGSIKERRAAKAWVPIQCKKEPTKSRGYDSESSEEEDTDATAKESIKERRAAKARVPI